MPDVTEASTTSIADDVSLLSEEPEVQEKEAQKTEEVEEPAVEKPKEASEEEEEEEEKEGEEEKKEEGEEDKVEENKFLHERPSIKQIREKYPNLFKDFPSLKDVYFREREFSEIFPTIDDAKEANENSESLVTIRDEVFEGRIDKFFSAIAEADQKTLDKVALNVLPTLQKMSPDLHWRVLTPVLESVVRSFYNEGKSRRDDNIINSALFLSEFLFNDQEVAKGTKTNARPVNNEDSDERRALREERERFERERRSVFSTDVMEEASTKLKEMILQRGKHNKLLIDPDGVLTDFIKDVIVTKTIAEVGKQMDRDKSHMNYMDSLWRKAKQDGYVGDWKSRIVNAYLARAKSLVPAIRSRLVSEALGASANDNRRSKSEEINSRKEGIVSGKESGPKNYRPQDIDWRRTSDEDFLNDRVTLRKG